MELKLKNMSTKPVNIKPGKKNNVYFVVKFDFLVKNLKFFFFNQKIAPKL